jgi:large subunit ribosomal protein L17
VTSPAKARAARPLAERLIRIATDESKARVHRFRLALARLDDKPVVQRLFSDIAPQCAARNGGYVRILKLPARRLGDNGEAVVMELVDAPAEAAGEEKRGIVSRLVGRGKAKKQKGAAPDEEKEE